MKRWFRSSSRRACRSSTRWTRRAPWSRRRCATSGPRQELRPERSSSNGTACGGIAATSAATETCREDLLDRHPAAQRHGSLHIGHALNNTLQDILCPLAPHARRRTLWLPGTDHAGIATQNVVERQLAAEGIDRRAPRPREVRRARLGSGRRRIRQDDHHASIARLGVSCDWERERFTMDEGLSRAVREVFVTLYEDGLIYRGDRYSSTGARAATRRSPISRSSTNDDQRTSGTSAIRSPTGSAFDRGRDHAARDDARRHRGGRASGRRALPAI